MCPHDLLTTEDCVILYPEMDCQTWYDSPVRLKHGHVFTSNNCTVARTIVTRPGCWITMKTRKWDLLDDIVNRDKHHADFMNTLSHGLGGEEFSCFCSPGPQTNQATFLPSEIRHSTDICFARSQDSNNKVWIVTAGIMSAVLMAVALGVIAYRYYSGFKYQRIPADGPRLSSERSVRQFRIEDIANQNDDVVEMSPPTIFVRPFDEKFEIPRTRFIIDVRNVLGQGHFGIVYKGKLKVSEYPTNIKYIDVAIKTLKPFATAEYIKPLLNEIKVISYIGHHPNIVCFLGACTWDLRNGDIFNLMEFCGKGSLKEHLENIKPVQQIHIVLEVNNFGYSKCDIDAETQGNGIAPARISDDLYQLLLKWSGEIAAGMHYLSCKNVVHIDLAGRNIFLTNDLVAKIGDFGLSRKLYSVNEYDKKGSDAVPVGWIALECMKDNKYSTKSDVWAYGIVLYEIFSFGAEPYAEKSGREIFAMLNSGNRLPCPAFATPEMYAIMRDCWKENPESRPSFRDLENFFDTYLVNRKLVFVSPVNSRD